MRPFENHLPHHQPHHIYKAGETLIGFPLEILKLLFSDADDAEWAIENIINEGPHHKQIRSALLLKHISVLLGVVSKITGQNPEVVPGNEILSEDHHEFEGYVYPVKVPEEILLGVKDRTTVLKEIGMGAPHDVLRDLILFAAIQWIQEQLSKLQNPGNDEKEYTQ